MKHRPAPSKKSRATGATSSAAPEETVFREVLVLIERALLNPPKLSAALRVSRPEAADIFKDSYIVEFLQLPAAHSEADLHLGLVARLKAFLSELGRDFCFVGSGSGNFGDPPGHLLRNMGTEIRR